MTETGTIKKLVSDRGFGFIKPDDQSSDVFFHASGMAPEVRFDSLSEGQAVEYGNR